ncbi:MAG: hypothetical protein PHQ62_00045 [Clostridia bacterium]|nr:hypothetical protein [Clostridia bacterium]
MLDKDIVYMVQFEYSTDDCQGTDIYLYKERKDAWQKFHNLQTQEKEFYKTEYSHIDDFEVDTNIDDKNACEYWYNTTCQSNFYLHSFIDLKVKEVE